MIWFSLLLCNYMWCKTCHKVVNIGTQHSCDGSSEFNHLITSTSWKYCPSKSFSFLSASSVDESKTSGKEFVVVVWRQERMPCLYVAVSTVCSRLPIPNPLNPSVSQSSLALLLYCLRSYSISQFGCDFLACHDAIKKSSGCDHMTANLYIYMKALSSNKHL
jgi:hypothetical protein